MVRGWPLVATPRRLVKETSRRMPDVPSEVVTRGRAWPSPGSARATSTPFTGSRPTLSRVSLHGMGPEHTRGHPHLRRRCRPAQQRQVRPRGPARRRGHRVRVGVDHQPEHRVGELGYTIRRDCWGRAVRPRWRGSSSSSGSTNSVSSDWPPPATRTTPPPCGSWRRRVFDARDCSAASTSSAVDAVTASCSAA